MAIERERYERNLKAALARQQVLVKEMSHRIKNSLAIVAGMLRLQSTNVGNPELTHHLNEAAQRVVAIARAHERIHQGSKVELLDLGRYIEQVCKDLDDVVTHCSIHVDVPDNVEIATDRAIPLALIVNELMTNAAKYAYKDREGGTIWVRVTHEGDALTLRVRDAGAGLPDGFDPHKAKSLGMRIVVAFVEQLEGTLSVRRLEEGAEFVVTVPLGAKHVDP
jgi:two-component sensor histidine kinase